MASGNRRFSVHEVLDFLDDSADGECTVDDEPVMEGSDDEDILFEEYDSFIDTENRHSAYTIPHTTAFANFNCNSQQIHSHQLYRHQLQVDMYYCTHNEYIVINCTGTNYKYTTAS